MNDLAEILAAENVHSVYQPIVDLDTEAVVAYEALARGPVGSLQRPDHLFTAAAAAGRLADLDELCQRAALQGAIAGGIFAPLTLFINIEPEVVRPDRLERLLSIAQSGPGDLQLMLEITERALAVRPADLLATVRRLRAAGWRIALDDVGADDLSLAFMPLLRPDVIKLDMALVQGRPGHKAAQIMNAVNAHAERTGAVILAEGVETVDHLATARALGATLGQGWLFGRPAEGPVPGRSSHALRLPPLQPVPGEKSPFQCLPGSVTLRRSTKALLIEVSKHLEREAKRLGRTCVVISTFQHAHHFTPSTARRYQDLAEHVGFVAALGADLDVEPVPGVRGADVQPGDPIRDEWDIAVLAPHFAAALIARDLGYPAADNERSFEFALTYDRNTVEAAARSLMSRVRPNPSHPTAPPATVEADDNGEARKAGQASSDRSPLVDRINGNTDAADPDPDTGLIDRSRLLELIEAALLEATINNTGAAIIHLHLDTPRFADHPAAQAILKAAINRLQRRIRRRDLITHHHGDIIIVLNDLDQANAPREAQQLCASMAADLSTPTAQQRTDPLTVSIGISTFPADGHEIAQLVQTAERRSSTQAAQAVRCAT